MEEIIVSYSVPNPSAPTTRPSVVTAAGYLLYAAAAIWIIDGLLPLAGMNKVVDVYKEVYANTSQSSTAVTAARVGLIIGVVVSVLFGVGTAVLASFDLRGSNVARIITWVWAGLNVLCFGCGAVASGLSGSITNMGRTNVNGVDQADLARRVSDARGSWFQPVDVTLKVIGLIAMILVIVLLALGASNAYFRRDKTAMVAEPGYPGLQYPSYPQAPGQSPYPTQPPTNPGGDQPGGGQPPAQP